MAREGGKPIQDDETQTIVVGLKRKQTLVLPPGARIVTFRKPRKGLRKGSAILTVPKGTKVKREK